MWWLSWFRRLRFRTCREHAGRGRCEKKCRREKHAVMQHPYTSESCALLLSSADTIRNHPTILH